MTKEQDKTLASKIAEGDSQAENELFQHFKERIQFLVRMRLKGKASKQDREDIISEIQEAVLLSLRKGGYDPTRGTSLEAYIGGIASNIVAQYFRRLKKEQEAELDEWIQTNQNSENILSNLLDAERNEKLRACLMRLKSKYREVLLLRIYEKKSIAEIGQELNVPPRRVSERIHYAFKLLLKECKKENYFQYYDAFSK